MVIQHVSIQQEVHRLRGLLKSTSREQAIRLLAKSLKGKIIDENGKVKFRKLLQEWKTIIALILLIVELIEA